MYSHRKAALVGGAGGPRMLDVYRVGTGADGHQGMAVVAPVALSGLKGMETRVGLAQGLSVALTHGGGRGNLRTTVPAAWFLARWV